MDCGISRALTARWSLEMHFWRINMNMKLAAFVVVVSMLRMLCWRNGQSEAVGAERMRLSQNKSRSGMIMLVWESLAYPNRQYGFPACCLLSVTSNTCTHSHQHTHRSPTESSCLFLPCWQCLVMSVYGVMCETGQSAAHCCLLY